MFLEESIVCCYGGENRRIEVALNIVCVVGETPATCDFDQSLQYLAWKPHILQYYVVLLVFMLPCYSQVFRVCTILYKYAIYTKLHPDSHYPSY